MQFLYHKDAGLEILEIDGESYKYLFRVRRFKVGDIIELRNLQDSKLYSYKITSINKKSAILNLIFGEEKKIKPSKNLTIGWCIIDPKTVEKSLPSLNEIGVFKIVFIKCAYSQANFKINIDRLKKIAINSSQQCGRSSLIEFEFAKSLEDFLSKYPDSYLLNFSQNYYSDTLDISSIVVGCEGGLSQDEIALFEDKKIVGLRGNLILKSETAVTAIASKILL